jgi:Fe-Mn family superoxide dismutase
MTTEIEDIKMAYQHANKQEALLAKVKGKTGKISDKTHEEHLKLYTGYVNKTNAILKELEELSKTLDPANAAQANQIYSTLRSLKLENSFALGGVVNHELYFGVMGGGGGPATGRVARLIEKSFGSFDAYKKDLKATAISARGWAWTIYDPKSDLLFNHLGDSQSTYSIWGVTPILALDTYEHAYYADFFTARAAYIDEFLNVVDWDQVNANLK